MAPPIGPNPGGGPGGQGGGGQGTGCDCANITYEKGHLCYNQCKGGSTAPSGGCPPGQELINGKCRYPGDFPCPAGQCKDVVTGICRTPGKAEKVRQSDAFDVRGLCKQTGGGGGGGGGMGGGGGAGAPGAPKLPGITPGAGFNSLIGIGTGRGEPGGLLAQKLMELLNQGSAYTPEARQAALANTKRVADAGAMRATEDAKSAMAASGTFNSGMTASIAAGARRGAAAQVAQTGEAFEMEKVKNDFNQRLQGVKAAQEWLDSIRSYAATLDQTAADREKTAATIALGYAQIAAQKDMLAQQLASNKSLLQMQLNSAEWLALLRLQQGF